MYKLEISKDMVTTWKVFLYGEELELDQYVNKYRNLGYSVTVWEHNSKY